MKRTWTWRRRSAAAMAMMLAVEAAGTVLHRWEFDDAAGTALGTAVNAASGQAWAGADAATAADWSTDGTGALRLGSTTNTVDAFLGLPGVTNGSLLVRVDYDGWELGPTDGDEQVSFYLEGTGNVRLELLRFFDGAWDLSAWSPPDLGTVQQYATSMTNRVCTILELDLDRLRYRAWWGDGSAFGWTRSPWSPANPSLSVASLRFRKAGDFTQAGDTVRIDRITVADRLGDVVELPPYPENLLAGWVDGTEAGTVTVPGLHLVLDPAAGEATVDDTFDCSDGFYGPDGDPAFATGPDDVMVSALTFQSNQYALVTLTNQSAGPVVLEALRFDWGARFNGSPRFFYLSYEEGSLDGVAGGTLLWSVTRFEDSVPAGADVDDYHDAAVDLTTLADHTLEDGEHATFRIAVGEFGDAGKSLVDNLGFFGAAPPPRITTAAVTTVPSPVEVILFDFGTDATYRGLSVVNPDPNGNHWNNIATGVFYTQLVDVAGSPTEVDFGFSSGVPTDSYNGPAGPTSVPTLADDALNTDIDADALGRLGVTNAVFDFVANNPLTFEIQGLDPARRYNLSFFGSHKYNDAAGLDNTTVYSVFADDGYTELVDQVSLLVGEGAAHNRDTVAVLRDLAPQGTNNFFYVQVTGSVGGYGYLNCMQLEATEPADAAVIGWDGKVGSVYRLEASATLDAADWTTEAGGLVGAGGAMAATALVARAASAYRVVEEVKPPPVRVFFDDFEGGAAGWTTGVDGVDTTQWELGTPANTGPAGAFSGANCWGTNIDRGYTRGAECWLRSPAIDLGGVAAATLNWRQAVDIEPEQGGAFYDWGEVNILDASGAVLVPELGGRIAGEDLDPPWTLGRQSLDAVTGQVIRIEFRFTSDTLIREVAGWYIDDVEVTAGAE